MNTLRIATNAITFGLLASASLRGAILVDLDPAAALYDSDLKGIVNDGGNGPGVTGNLSGVPAIEDTGTYTHAAGFTFNITFTPRAADLTGTRLLIEIGANSNGSGLYLINGVPTLASKQSSNDATIPSSLNDTSLNAIAVQSSIGKLEADVTYSVSASWNHEGTLEIAAAPEGSAKLLDSFAISGTPGNWSGNDTISVKNFTRPNLGGLGGNNAANVFGLPFDMTDTTAFGGTVTRALFWNANSVTALAKTAPVVKGFTVTRLPSSGKLRLHWDVTEGGLSNPTTISINDTANPGTVIHVPATLVGFADVTTTATSFTLTADNQTGSTSATSGVEQDTPFSAVVRQSGPSAWYRYNEANGSEHVVDSADNAVPFDGTVIGSPVAGGTGFIDKAGVFGGGSAVLGGSVINPGSLVPVAPGTPRQGFTIEAVVRRAAGPTGNHILVSQADQDGTGRVVLAINDDGTIYSQLAGGPSQKKDADEKLVTNVWSHLVLVVDPGTTDSGTAEIRWYLDGKKIGSTLDGTNPNGSTFNANFLLEASTGKWVLGSAKTFTSEFWKGDIDDIAIYPSLLDDPNGDGSTTDSRIPAHRNAWYSETNGIIQFSPSSATVNTDGSVQLFIRGGADVSSVLIDNGVGEVGLDNGYAAVTVRPTATTTYHLSANGAGGPYTAETTVVYQQLTLPVVYGFEGTTLPSLNKVRLHWKVTEGAFVTPTSVKLKSGETVLHESNSLTGFVDIDAASAVNVTLDAKNLIGTSTVALPAIAADTPFSAAVRASAPVAWFRFNETTGSGLIVDSAENAAPHNGTLTGPAVNANETGFIDGAGKFNANSAITTDRIIDLSVLEQGFTIEAIVSNDPGTGTNNRAIVVQKDLNGTGRQLLTVDDTGVIRANFGGGVRKDADTTIPARTWSHIVVVADVINIALRWYVDGVYAGTSKDGVNPDGTLFDPSLLFELSNGAWVIGANKDLDGNFWKGKIDDIVVYDKQLDDLNADGDYSDSVITAHRNAWWGETSGLIYSGASKTTIDPGEPVTLTLRVGADVTSVTVSNGGGTFYPDANGNLVITLNPSATTSYTITYNTANGSTQSTLAITVTGSGVVELTITSTAVVNGNFTLSFKGAPSTTYNVRGSTDLVTFPEIYSPATTNSAGEGTVSIPISPEKTKQFFRLESQ